MAIVACDSNYKSKQGSYALVDTSSKQQKADTVIYAHPVSDSSQKKMGSNSISDRILGIWAAIGDENATFVIDKSKITYPDQNASYEYTLVNDSMHIKFDSYDGNYLVKMKSLDTLILVGDEQQIYYRFKK